MNRSFWMKWAIRLFMHKIHLFIVIAITSDINKFVWWSVCSKLHERSPISCRNHIIKQRILIWLSQSRKVPCFPHRIDVQMYLCKSSNHEKINNTSTHLSSNAKQKYELVFYNTTCTTLRSTLILINC